MRIVHLVARSHRRGAEMVAMELAEELDGRGHRNRVVALGLAHDGGRDPQLPPLVSRVSVGVDVLVADAWRLRRLLRSEPADVVLAHGGWAVQVAAVATPRGGPAVVWQRILGFPESVWRTGRRRWWQLVLRRVDAAVALTGDLEDELRRLGFAGPVWVIANARRTDRFDALDRDTESSWLRGRLGVAPDLPLIGFVGHLVDQKRPERAVEVLSRLHAMGREAHLVVAGGGPLADALEREVRSRLLSDHVSLLGHRNDVERILAGIDLLVLPSDHEGIPGVAIEAQMAGCPVVTFPLGGVGEVVDDGVTGIVLGDHDTATMAAEVSRLLGDPARRRRMSVAARRRSARFSVGHTADAYEDRLGPREAPASSA
ncbi:MAG: glycosyltransferase family 4 protein [Acidimicrobiales bacterium]